MKICPRCSQQYADDSLNFCLNDGAVLNQAGAEPPPTVLINQPRPTAQNQQFGVPPNQNWGVVTPNAAAPPRPKSRAWLWVLGIFGGIILLCGGGFVALIALVPDAPPTVYNSNYSNTSNISNTNRTNASIQKDDLSSWRPNDFADNRLTMASNQVGYYFVLVSPKKDFRTENATTKVTVKNTTGAGTTYGFGLLVHSNQTTPLEQDYAFLIDTNSQKFRVARHSKKDEKTVVSWKYLSAIKSGTEENVLEVRDEKGKMGFFINGQLAAEYTDSVGFKSGVAGLYVSDAVPIAFSNLEIRK